MPFMNFCTLLCGFILMSVQQVIAATYHLYDDSDLVGSLQSHVIRSGDTWQSIAYFYDVGYDELREANPTIVSLSKQRGQIMLIPTMHVLPERQYRRGIVVNLAEKRLYFFPKGVDVVYTYPISIGKNGWKTPQFNGYIYNKKVAPVWNVPKSIKNYYLRRYNRVLPDRMPPGKNNPLGNYALYTSKSGILIHGTNQESSIGREVSSGCVRMFNRNIQELFYLVNVGDRVHFIHHDEKLGLDDSTLFFEKHKPYYPNDQDSLYEQLDQLDQDYDYVVIDHDKIANTHADDKGVPDRVGYVTE